MNEIERKIKNCRKELINSNINSHELSMIKTLEF